MKQEGRIRAWDDKRGFGFIRTEGSAGRREREDVFVHISSFNYLPRRPLLGDIVTYTRTQGQDGRSQAADVSIVGHERYKHRRSWNRVPILFALAIGIGATVPYQVVVLLGVLIVLNLATFIAYKIDKSAAQKNDGRISEGTLLLMGLLGGWPAALVAQRTLRHKTSKSSFQILFWLTSILSILCWGSAIYYFLLPYVPWAQQP